MSQTPADVTRLLRAIHGGDTDARTDLWSLVYDELRRLAGAQMARERGEHTLQATALVHEAWLRLCEVPGWESRAHFFGVAAEAMRRILVEHARRRAALRRGGGMQRVTRLDLGVAEPADGGLSGMPDDLAALDGALTRLEGTGRHVRKCEVVKLRFFVGLTVEQTAEVLGISVSSVKRDWEFAKAWLSREVGGQRRGNRSP